VPHAESRLDGKRKAPGVHQKIIRQWIHITFCLFQCWMKLQKGKIGIQWEINNTYGESNNHKFFQAAH
jgi:hypothetical protein